MRAKSPSVAVSGVASTRRELKMLSDLFSMAPAAPEKEKERKNISSGHRRRGGVLRLNYFRWQSCPDMQHQKKRGDFQGPAAAAVRHVQHETAHATAADKGPSLHPRSPMLKSSTATMLNRSRSYSRPNTSSSHLQVGCGSAASK